MSEYVLELKGITKIFPGVKALNNVQFQLKPGEVHALMGENEEFVINKERTKIGKKAAVVDICIQGNKTISREHCIITFEEGVFFLEDCHSLNHTYLNKTELEPEIPVRLETDSEIQMSDELFDFIIEEG